MKQEVKVKKYEANVTFLDQENIYVKVEMVFSSIENY